MLDSELFVDTLSMQGYTHFCAVPCSFAKDIINEIINSEKLIYVPCASEAVACSVAAGLKISGKKPILLAQSSGLTNMGSCITSLLMPYEIMFPIVISWRTYKDGDSEIQHQHLATELPKLIEAYGYTYNILDNENLNTAIEQINFSNHTHNICILPKDTFSKVKLDKKNETDLSAYPKRSEFLTFLNRQFKNSHTTFIGTTGNTAREMYSFMPDTHNFYMVGNMGGALSLATGIAMGKNNVIVCGGDAEFVMHMGGLTTAGRYPNLKVTYIVFDNEQNKSTGGQNTYQSHIDYVAIARASGFSCYEKTIVNIDDFAKAMNEMEQQTQGKLNFLHVKCSLDEETPRPPIEVVKTNKVGQV